MKSALRQMRPDGVIVDPPKGGIRSSDRRSGALRSTAKEHTATLPNFLYIGPDKSGSSWLFHVLSRHAECYVPAAKDIYFFDRYYDRGLDWYHSFFKGAPPGAKAIGELSHDYLFSTKAASRIARDLPGVRLVSSLRNPVERTFSHYLYLVRSGLTNQSFEVALEQFPELIDNSLYAKHLAVYFRKFDRAKIKVLLFDRLQDDPCGFASELFEFLEMSLTEKIPYEDHVLPAGRPRSAALARVLKVGANVARDLGFPDIVGRIKRGPLSQVVYQTYAPEERPVVAEATARRLACLFEADVHQLEQMLAIDLSRWRISRRGRA
jgi:hypothetical protein